MSLQIFVNTGLTDQEYNTSGAEFTEFSEGNDQLIFTAGSDVVKDGEPIPSQSELIQAGVILTGAEITVDKYLLSDLSANELKEIFNMGNQNKRYVLAFVFNAATASEPTFEVWDDSNLNTVLSIILGGGSPSASMIRGVTTTDGAPGADWAPTGTKMAGSSSGNFLYLNNQNGALSGADTLYANLAIIVPASQTTGFSANPVFVAKWLSN